MKKIIVFLLSLTIAFTPSLVFASGGFSPWTVNSLVSQGASTILTGSKEVILNGAKKVATGTAKITPVAADVSKLLVKGVGGVALTFAVQQLLGAVDWVLDPVNNQIKYKDSNNTACLYMSYVASRTDLAACGLQNAFQNYINKVYGKTALVSYKDFIITSCRANGATGTSVASGTCYFTAKHKTTGDIIDSNETLHSIANPNHSTDQEEKTIPLNTVAERIISNAQSGNAAAQSVTTAAAADIVAEAEKDNVKARPIINQLENTQAIPTDQTAKGDSKPQDTTGTGEPTAQPRPQDITLNFPVFCNWAPSVCQAAKEVIALPITLTNWWDTSTKSISESWTTFTDFMNWTKKEPDKSEKENIDIDTPVPFDTSIFTKDRFQVSRQCPVPEQHTINLSGISVNFAFDMSPLCRVLELARPALIACSYLYAAYIVIGAARNG